MDHMYSIRYVSVPGVQSPSSIHLQLHLIQVEWSLCYSYLNILTFLRGFQTSNLPPKKRSAKKKASKASWQWSLSIWVFLWTSDPKRSRSFQDPTSEFFFFLLVLLGFNPSHRISVLARRKVCGFLWDSGWSFAATSDCKFMWMGHLTTRSRAGYVAFVDSLIQAWVRTIQALPKEGPCFIHVSCILHKPKIPHQEW